MPVPHSRSAASRVPAQINVLNNQFVDNMCSGTDGYTYNLYQPFTHTSQPLSFTNVSALNLVGNTITATGSCAATQARATT